ncbi:uncharacterized protein K452DRAFT_361517 [Aplosporella prunicola CBS 121167]|uniref:Ecp2 effector protein domain-containing protein n=1 Tax=Aplosporella prunicola CBS 121167 TaxID=1176127 RepID=A0A6A6B363_9PEZI|nr:uncharacterized protein K452DRAFT_361517 [Aplosporella prunicola CBS 121167]KAF2138038.1 hypothetical protein K452DRAFT_361517 [Aplosporella prunicola CBS 121167]
MFATALFLAASLPLSVMAGITCETTDGSPSTEAVTEVINQVRGQGGDCEQTNHFGSNCTTLVHHDGAAIAICGPYGNYSPCTDVAHIVTQIQDQCLVDGRAGGTYTFEGFPDTGETIELISS